MPLPLLIVLASSAAAVLAALDAGLRRAGLYTPTAARWPAAWRAVRAARADPSPYREGADRPWVLVVRPGIPRATSLFLAPVLGMVLVWSLATALAVGDFADVARGTRSLPFVLASLSLCIVHVLIGCVTLLAAWGRRCGLFPLASVLALGLDVALAWVALPCSDSRADDVHMALAGVAAQAALALGFAVSLWARRGLVSSADPALPPEQRG